MRALSMRAFVREALAALAPGIAPATPLAVALATHVVVKEVARERLLPGAGEVPTEATAAALASTLDRAVGTLRRAGHVSPGAARRSLGVWAAAVQTRVDARLQQAGWFDARGAGALLARRFASAYVEELDELGVLGGVVLSDVLPWDGDDLMWLEALHGRSRDAGGAGVTLRLPRFSGVSPADGAAAGASIALGPLVGAEDPLAHALERRWATAEDAPEVVWTTATPGRVIEVRGARTAAAEARAIGAAVQAAFAAGLAPERIAIVVPAVSEEALAPLGAALTEARVPFAEPRGRSILACPDGRAAIALLGLAEGPFTRDGLLEVLRAPGLHAGVWVEASDEVEAATRAGRLASRLRDVPVDVDGSGRLFGEALTALVADAPDDAWMPRALERMVASVRWIAEAGTLREGCSRLLTLLDRSKLGQPSARDLAAALGDEKRGFGPLATSAMGENASALRRLREIVIEVGRAAEAMGLGGAPVSAAELRALVRGLADRTGARAGGTAARAGAVRIGRPEDVAGLPFDRLIVTGMVEGAYGDEGDEEDLLATEDEGRERVARARSPRRALALATALASAPELVLTYATGDEEEPRKQHALVTLALAGGASFVIEPASRLSPRAAPLGPRGAALIALAGGRPPPADLAARVQIERSRLAFFMDPRTEPDDFTGRVRVDADLAGLLPALVGGTSEEASIAVTAIERAVGCSFAGFARRVLRIQRKEDVAEAGDARERGTLVHRALQAVFQIARDGAAARGAAAPGGGLVRGGDARRAALAAAREAAEVVLGLERIVSPLRREAISSAVRDALTVLVRAWDDDDPMAFLIGEQRFGRGAPHPWSALALLPADGEEESAPAVFVDGQIDRIDVAGDRQRVRIIDYKTGRLPDGDQKRTALQLPLYASVAMRALGASSVEAMYLRVTPRGMIDEQPKQAAARLVKAEDLSLRAREARRAVRALWEGRIAPRPAFLSLCASCDARDLCRRPAVMPIEEQEERS